VEVLIALSVFSIFTTGIVSISLNTLQRSEKAMLNNESLLYAEECMEAVRSIKDRDYLELASGEYGLSFADDLWSLIASPEIIDEYYSRTVTIEDVYRNDDGDIAETGTIDEEVKKITCDVAWDWKGVLPLSSTLTSYMTNWRGYTWVETTCTDFDAGTYDLIDSGATTAPPEDNCGILLDLVEAMSAFFSSVDVGDHGDDVVVSGNYAYLAGAKVAEGFVVSDISNHSSPFVVKKLDVGAKGRYLVKSGNYIYLGVEKSNAGFATIDVTDPTNPSVVKTINFSAYGNQPAVSGSYLYMGLETNTNSFRVYDISIPADPTQVAYLDFSANTNVIHIDGNYAYVGTDKSGSQLKVVDITTPTSPSTVASLDIGSEIQSIEIYGTVAYVGVEGSSSLKIVNITNPLSPSVIGTLVTSGEVQDLVYHDGYVYAAIDNNNPGLDAINVSSPMSPYVAYSADITGKGTGAYVDDGYVFLSTDISNKGLVIKEALSAAYADSGTYISATLDTGSEATRYNFIDWDYTDTVGGSVKMQIRTASTISGLATATWVGSDGTNSTYYETPRTSITIDPSATGKRYIQFMVTITSDTIETPMIESIYVDYNP